MEKIGDRERWLRGLREGRHGERDAGVGAVTKNVTGCLECERLRAQVAELEGALSELLEEVRPRTDAERAREYRKRKRGVRSIGRNTNRSASDAGG